MERAIPPKLWNFRQFYQVYADRFEILSPAGRELADTTKLSPTGRELTFTTKRPPVG